MPACPEAGEKPAEVYKSFAGFCIIKRKNSGAGWFFDDKQEENRINSNRVRFS